MMDYSFEEVILDWRTGLNPRKNFKLGQGTNNYITIKDIHDGKIVVTEKTDKVNDAAIALIERRSHIKNGDILFSSIGRIGDTAIVSHKDHTWDVNESVFVFTPNTRIITAEYFCLLFKSTRIKDFLSRNSTGTTFPSIKMNQLKKLRMELPSLEEQKAITGLFSKISLALAEKKQNLSCLDSLVKSRFRGEASYVA